MPRIQLDDNASWHDPADLGDLMEALTSFPSYPPTITIDAVTALQIRSALGTLDHILCHPAGTESIIRQLRQARRILRERD